MKILREFLMTLAVLTFLSACQSETFEEKSIAEPMDVTSKDYGAYVLHFNGISTDMLEPKIAQTYGIVRSKNRALLTLSIIQKKAGTPGKPVSGTVKVNVNNLTGQAKNMKLRKIEEGNAIYYIGDVAVINTETLVFNISATPTNESDSLDVRFLRQFFVD